MILKNISETVVWMLYFMPRSPVFLMEKVQRAALTKTTLSKDDF